MKWACLTKINKTGNWKSFSILSINLPFGGKKNTTCLILLWLIIPLKAEGLKQDLNTEGYTLPFPKRFCCWFGVLF